MEVLESVCSFMCDETRLDPFALLALARARRLGRGWGWKFWSSMMSEVGRFALLAWEGQGGGRLRVRIFLWR